MADLLTAAIAANRLGLGARPGDLEALAADPRGALRAQIAGTAPVLVANRLQDSATVLAQAAELRRERVTEKRAAPSADSGEFVVAVAAKLGALYRPIYLDECVARLQAGVASDRSFIERMVHFWSNHFAVSVDKRIVMGVAGAFEREAIRPHVLGSFRDMLLAVEQHPAMLLYLDNFQSVGPGSDAARVVSRRAAIGGGGRKVGINENLAREILELHTLGADGGYTQSDVTEFAKVITGWSMGGGRGRLRGGEPGRFYFREALHEPGAKQVVGKRYNQDGASQGVAVLHDLARSPATAHHVATKLARHFIADEPPAAAVDRLAHAFLKNDGDLPALYRALIDSPELWFEAAAKFKTPSDYIYSAHRALGAHSELGRSALQSFELLGQRNFSPGSPAGWPDRSADWDGSSSVLKRVEWADQLGQRFGNQVNAVVLAPQVLGSALTSATRTAIARAESAAQGLTLLLAAPEFMRR